VLMVEISSPRRLIGARSEQKCQVWVNRRSAETPRSENVAVGALCLLRVESGEETKADEDRPSGKTNGRPRREPRTQRMQRKSSASLRLSGDSLVGLR